MYFDACHKCVRRLLGREEEEALFKPSVLFQLLYNDGWTRSWSVTSKDIESCQKTNFAFKDSDAEYTLGRGFQDFLEKDALDDRVKDNICTVICTLIPST